jgi:8-oxo-dGTP pyrophosphatase MutT (NUDIX family)
MKKKKIGHAKIMKACNEVRARVSTYSPEKKRALLNEGLAIIYGKRHLPTASVAVYLILQRKMKVLMMLRDNTGYQDGMWETCAGHVDDTGETPLDAMCREAKEELGITIDKNDLKFVHLSSRPKHDPTGIRIDIFFECGKWRGEPNNVEPCMCKEIRWFDPHDLPKNVTPHVKDGVDNWSCFDEHYSEMTLNEVLSNPLYKRKK